MVVVSAAAFAVGAACLYYATRALRTRRAMRRLDGATDPTDWLEPPGERSGADPRAQSGGDHGTDAGDDGGADPAVGADAHSPVEADPRDGVSIERGFVLAVLGVLCLLFGFLAL